MIWCVTKAGKRMPVDAEPVPEHEVDPDKITSLRVIEHAGEAPPLALPASGFDLGRVPLHTSHFATCPQAATWRRKEGASR